MHIVAILIAVAGVIGVVLWRLQQASMVAREMVDVADDARGFFRRWGWQRKFAKSPLDLVNDPREAAAVMMVAVGQADGHLTERERLMILQQMVNHFGASGEQAEALYGRARWVVNERTDAGEVLRRMAAVIKRTCGDRERADVLAMLNTVASAEGAPDGVIAHDLAQLGHLLKG